MELPGSPPRSVNEEVLLADSRVRSRTALEGERRGSNPRPP
jgi:hypothetical protein